MTTTPPPEDTTEPRHPMPGWAGPARAAGWTTGPVPAAEDEAVEKSAREAYYDEPRVVAWEQAAPGLRRAMIAAARAALADTAGAPRCSTCNDTRTVPWEPGAHRTSEDDEQPCPDCAPRTDVSAEQAWDEGYDQAYRDGFDRDTPNPYRTS